MKRFVAGPLMVLASLAASQPVSAPISGYEFMEPSTQQLQDDDFINPAFFLVDKGRELWTRTWQESGQSCQSCHGDAETSMRGVAARYPAWDEDGARMINLEQKLNQEITLRLQGQPLPWESEELLALTAFVSTQSRGMPMEIEIDDQVQVWIDRGREIFEAKQGQLNLSCQNCHEDHWGDKLRGDTLSQGHINAFPIFRLTWGEVGSRQRIFTWCLESIRAEAYPAGSDQYIALETYLAVRGAGLMIESPGVRR